MRPVAPTGSIATQLSVLPISAVTRVTLGCWPRVAYRDFDLRRQWSAWESFYEFTQTHVRWSDGWLAHLDEAASVSERSPNATGIEGPSDESSEEPGTEARIEEEREESRDRRSQVDAFLEECNRVNDSPGEILRKHISLAGGHKTPRQFQRWQSSSDKAPAEDARRDPTRAT